MDVELCYHPNADQVALAETMSGALREILPLSRLHRSQEESAETWAALDDLGIFRMTVGEEWGGSGLGATEEAMITLGLGRQLAAPAVLASLGVAHALGITRAYENGATPHAAAAFRRDGQAVIVEDTRAMLILLRDASSAALHRAPIVTEVMDAKLWGVSLLHAKAPSAMVAPYDGDGLLRLRLLDAAALSGLADAALTMAVAYAGVREQFGRPIGAFQAVKHHCANMAIAARSASDQTRFAAMTLDAGREDAALQVECALLVAGSAALENASKNIQIHGAIGFSDEADPHLLVKRAHLLLTLAGGLEMANARIAAMQALW